MYFTTDKKNSLLDSDDDFHWGYQLPLHVPTTVLTTGLFKIDNCAWLCYKLNVLASLKYWISNEAQNPNRTRLVLCVVNFMVYLCENKNNSKLLKKKNKQKKRRQLRPSDDPQPFFLKVYDEQFINCSWALFPGTNCSKNVLCVFVLLIGYLMGELAVYNYPVDYIFCMVVEIAWFMVYTCTVSFTDVVQGHRKCKGTEKL